VPEQEDGGIELLLSEPEIIAWLEWEDDDAEADGTAEVK